MNGEGRCVLAGLLLVCFQFCAGGRKQPAEISGTVTDQSGSPCPPR